MVEIDLTTNMGSLTFRNPVLPGASEIAYNPKAVKKCIENGVGGIVTKSYTTIPAMMTRPRPYQFFYRKLGRGLEYSWLTTVRLDTLPGDKVVKEVFPEMVRLCRKAEIPLIASVCQSNDPDEWADLSVKFAESGVDAVELNFGCPQTLFLKGKIPVGTTIGANMKLSSEIVRRVKKEVKCPVWVKMSSIYSPPEEYALAWRDAGADALSAHTVPLGMVVDVDREEPFGAPFVSGYLPGRAFLPCSLARIVQMRGVVPEMPISGIGGIFEAEDAVQYLLIGCKTVQLVSVVYQRGYGVFRRVVEGIRAWMGRKGYTKLDEFVGKAYNKVGVPPPEAYPIPCPSPEEENRYAPQVDMERCNFCGICGQACLYDVFKVNKARKTIEVGYEGRCWGCGVCIGLCPVNALSLVDKKTGETVWGNEGVAKTLVAVR